MLGLHLECDESEEEVSGDEDDRVGQSDSDLRETNGRKVKTRTDRKRKAQASFPG